MKNINAYEYKDLGKDIQAKVKEEFINNQVEAELDVLAEDLNANLITEEYYYKQLGCSKSYALTTSWFISACYYEKNQKKVNEDVKGTLETCLFTKDGQFIQHSN